MSDSHDNLYALKTAIQFFNKQQVELVLHAGDMTSPFMVKALKELKTPFKMCFGNNDGDRLTLQQWLLEINAEAGDFIETTLHGRKIGMLHGTNQTIVNALVKSNTFDVIISGHTHTPSVNHGTTLHINPGEVSGVLSGSKTIALLEPKTLKAEIITL
jgi:hypothetical protein